MRAIFAEIFGTFLLVLGGCGAVVFAAGYGQGPNGTSLGLGFLGVSLAFGFSVVAGAYAVGHVSGGHFNPAVTLGLTFGGRFPIAKVPGYVIAQVIGGTLAAYVIYVISTGLPEFSLKAGAGVFATNGFGKEGSPAGYSMMAVLITEVVTTALFLIVIMGTTAKRAAVGFAGIPIGLMLALIHFVTIPISNTSVNPARSTGPAVITSVFGEGITVPMDQLWFFWAAPIAGGIIGALIFRTLIDSNND